MTVTLSDEQRARVKVKSEVEGESLWAQSQPGVWCLFVPARRVEPPAWAPKSGYDVHHSVCGRWMRCRAKQYGRGAPPEDAKLCERGCV